MTPDKNFATRAMIQRKLSLAQLNNERRLSLAETNRSSGCHPERAHALEILVSRAVDERNGGRVSQRQLTERNDQRLQR